MGAQTATELKIIPVICYGGLLTRYEEEDPKIIPFEDYLKLEGQDPLILDTIAKFKQGKVREGIPVRIPAILTKSYKIELSDRLESYNPDLFNGRYASYQWLCRSSNQPLLQEVFETDSLEGACKQYHYRLEERRLKLIEDSQHVKRA